MTTGAASLASIPPWLNVSTWWRTFGRPPRIMGLDIARAIAITGMIGAHLGQTAETVEPSDPSTWSAIVHGNPSLLFALLAGFSISLMTRRGAIAPADVPAMRLRMLGRGATIFVIGLFLELLNTPIAVILTLYGVLYVAIIPLLRWRTSRLILTAALLGLCGPPLLALLTTLSAGANGGGISLVLFGSYPITVWLCFGVTGMVLGRLRLDRTRTAVWFVVVGVVLLTIGYGLGDTGTSADPGLAWAESPRAWAGWLQLLGSAEPFERMLDAVLAAAPHSGGVMEILGAGGLGVAVIGVCILLSAPLRWVLLPFAALGSMPLSAYSAHVVSYVLMAGPGGFISSNETWVWSVVVLLIATTAWSIFSGRGPLERLTARVADAAASAPPGAQRP
ncbi:heparan-alpha-glucosaminide N-acetyltransferase domain-containing protein [Microbacterium sp. LWO13-1.2]|uniref:heparan-alpha-glucosaminide N-acetyltransferase domain-containing protein n=1 Tax=Microbacterium sp. LWO13-1.2 TaxID=3135262 RepID=UPI003139EA93